MIDRLSVSVTMALICGTALLASCSKNDQAAQSGQVAARVGSDVVTVQELDNEFRLANVPNEKRTDPELVKKVLGEIVARKYMARQAVDAKLDREPVVLLDILRSKEQVLATALLARNVNAKISALSKADVDKYIASNPSKFANREVLRVDQVVIPLVANLQSVLEATKPMSSLDEVDAKLTELGVPHSRSTGALNTADIPDELANTLKTRSSQDIVFARSGQNGAFLKIIGTDASPLTGNAAENFARQLMRQDALRSEAALASYSASMQAKYEGDYSAIMGNSGAPAANR